MPTEQYQPGDIVVVSIQVETDDSYGYWIVLDHKHIMYPDGTKERVRCLSPMGTVVEWSPRYICYPESQVS